MGSVGADRNVCIQRVQDTGLRVREIKDDSEFLFSFLYIEHFGINQLVTA